MSSIPSQGRKGDDTRLPTVAESESTDVPSSSKSATPSEDPNLDPYVGRLERYELFCTNQSYYLVGCNKLNTAYRILKMDRTRIEQPVDTTTETTTTQPASQQPATPINGSSQNGAADGQVMPEATHTAKQTHRPLSEFLTEDPNVYTQEEIQQMLDMIHDGNRLRREDRKDVNGGGLKPIAKAYGIVGFIRFLDCYYLTLITRRAKVGSIGGNGKFSSFAPTV